jgi:hypothetical protein
MEVDLLGYGFSEDTSDIQGGTITPPTSYGDHLAASYVRTFESGITQVLGRKINREINAAQESGHTIPMDELNKRYPKMSQPFNRDMTEWEAKDLFNTDQRRKMLDNIIERGARPGALPALVDFGMTAVASMTDPLEIALGMGLGAGAARVMGKAAYGSLTGLKRFGAEAAENVVGNLASQLAVADPLRRQEMEDVDTWDSITGAVAGGIAFPALVGGARKIFGMLNAKLDGEEISGKMMVQAQQNLESGRSPGIDEELLPVLEKQVVEDFKADLEQMKNDPNVSKEILDDMEAHIKRIEETPELAREEVLKRHNSPERDYDYDPDIQKIVESSDNVGEVNEDFAATAREELQSIKEEIEANKELYTEAELKEINEEFSKVEVKTQQMDSIMKMAQKCALGEG